MNFRWAVGLLALAGLYATDARASGFGFTVTNAAVVNNDTNGNGVADVGETFTVTGATFSSYLSSGAAPAIQDNDLDRYSANINGTVVEVDAASKRVRYTGNFSVVYTGPAYPSGVVVETGSADFWAQYGAGGAASIQGVFMADPGVPAAIQGDPKLGNTDFAPYNPGRFAAQYAPTPGDPGTGTITANLNAGRDGFAVSIHEAVVKNNDTNGNKQADVGETFTLTTSLASYYPTNVSDAMLPLNHDDLDKYQVVMNGIVISVTGRTVVYNGSYSIRFTDATYPTGVDVETGTFDIVARYNETATGAAKLSGSFIATAGVPAAIKNDPFLGNTDFAVFNPGRFDGTYLPDEIGGDGTISGSITGGVIGFSATVGDGAIVNHDENGNGVVEVGETFSATGPLSAYMAVGAPPLYDKDLNRYTVSLHGTATSVVGTIVTYSGTFTLTYNAIPVDIESGNFTIVADYQPDGSALLNGTLVADAGVKFAQPPFDKTDYAPFNPAVFTGFYKSAGPTGTFFGSLTSGALVESLVSRKLGAAIEGSPSAAVTPGGARRALVATSNTLYVLDPATGLDASGWKDGKTLDGAVMGRPIVLNDQVFVGTDAGTLYVFNFTTGALLSSGKPGGAGSRILTAPAPVDRTTYGEAVDQVVVAYSTATSSAIVRVAADNVAVPTAGPIALSANAITTSSPSVPTNNRVFVGTNAGLFVLDYTTLAILSQTGDATLTSPLVVGGSAWLATGNGAAFRKLNYSTGAQESAYNLNSQMVLSAFYDKPNDLVYAGVADGRIVAFERAGAYAGLVLPGLFNPENTAGSWANPVATNSLVFRATENKQILFGLPFNGDSQGTIDLVSAVRGAVSATGPEAGADFVVSASPDGIIHMFSLPGAYAPPGPEILISVPMDQQINTGNLTNAQSPLGDAIYIPSNFNEQMEFKTEGGDSFTRVKIAGGSWYYGPYIDFRLAGIPDQDFSQGNIQIEFDARYYQPDDNTNRYADAPIFLRMYSYADDNDTLLGWKDFGIVYATQPSWSNPAYPDWTHVTVDWNSAAAANNGANVFDPTKISRMRLYGTDWFSPANGFGSFIDVKNFKVVRLP